MVKRDFFIDHFGIKLHARMTLPVERFDETEAGEQRWPFLLIIHGLTGCMDEEHLFAVDL